MVFRKAGESVTDNDMVAYLDALKACTPGEHHFSLPGLGKFDYAIQGPGDSGCQVMIVANGVAMQCEFSAKMVALLTTEEKYEDARNGVLQGSTDSAESELLAQECEVETS